MISFIEQKQPRMERVSALLDKCAQENHWANRGPLYYRLRDAYQAHFDLPHGCSVTPCANGAIALEAMARVLSVDDGRRLRWIASAFSFQNLGRGYFSDVQFVDCDEAGLLDLDAVKQIDPQGYDGIILVNPFGHFSDFSKYINFAKASGKRLLIDNAAGANERIPDWPWQSFSLHHTKPYGFGEGGLAVTPSSFSEQFYELLNYGRLPTEPDAWLSNGKISDVSCAFHIDRLEAHPIWSREYRLQAHRVDRIAQDLGFEPIAPVDDASPCVTSRIYTLDISIPIELLKLTRHATFAKYYKPLAQTENATSLFDRLINIPTHPGMANITDCDLAADISLFLQEDLQTWRRAASS